MILRLFLVLLIAVSALHAATFSATGFAETQIASGLNPTTMAFVPDGRLFLCEKQGRVRVVKNGALLGTPLFDISGAVDSWNERGMQSICVDPSFATNGWIYVYYTFTANKGDTTHQSSHNRVSRFTVSGDVAASSSELVLLDITNLSGIGWHNGGGLRFGMDGKLYISTGENANGGNAQNSGNLLGKILRLNKDGSIPTDNPNYGNYSGSNRAIVALGLRNPFTLAVQPGSGLLYVNDVGASYEEVNRYDTGSAPVALNYGWSSIDGPRWSQTPPAGYRDPVNAFNTGKSAICGGDFYNPASPGSEAFPSGTYNGRYFFCDYSGWIKYIDPANPGTRVDFASGINRPIDVEIAPDGALWYIARGGIGSGSDGDNTSTTNGSIWRVRYTGGGGPARLGILQQPTNVGAGVAISPAVRVAVQDASGNTVTSATNAVTIAIGANPSSGTLSGTLSVAAVNGVATFGNLSINNAGNGFTLTVASSGLTGLTSSTFNVMAQAAAPTITPNGGSFSGPVWVQFASATPSTTIRYTTDGSTPTGASPSYSMPFQRTATTTVKAIAQKSGLADSGVASATITISGTTAYGLDYRPPLNGVVMPAIVGGALPSTLGATGLFSSIANLTANSGLVPFTVNSPLWSDNAQKQRWVGLPGSARIAFAATGEYAWPGGTILVKHFELVTNESTGAKKRLETRVLVLDGAGTNGYGVTYKWRADNSDADLVADAGQDEVITITAAGGGTRTQSWRYPARSQCLQCHTTTSGFVLGPKTRQLNGTHGYQTGRSDNQLRTWNYLQMFTAPVSEAAIGGYTKLVKVDDSGATLENRARSYLDANCANCHRPGGTGAQWDARYDTLLADQNIINGAVRDTLGITGAKVVVPLDVPKSIMHLRMQSTVATQQMPPLARNVVDTVAVNTLAQWIGSLPAGGSGTILREYWTGVGGTAVSAIPLVNAPSGSDQLSSFEAPTDWADNYGTRVRGYLVPPATGTYTFWVAGDDSGELYLSTNDTVAAKQLIASVPDWTNSHEWTKFSQQMSAGITLNAGQRYYIEALQKEGAGGDNLAVAWQGPGLAQQVIAGQYLSPYTDGGTTAVFTSVALTPINATVVKSGTVQYAARAKDQTGVDLSPQPTFTWSTTGGGAIAASGLFTSSANGTFTMTAQATSGGITKSGTTQVTVTEPIAVRINFQPATSPTVAGYLVDSGLVYASRGNGFTYGWNANVTDTSRDRNVLTDQLRDTLLHTQKALVPNASWEIAVPNGRYQALLVSGDPSFFDGTYRVNIEGVLGVSGTPTTATRFFDSGNSFQVQVTDGRLTLTNGTGAVNNKMCFIEIVQVPVAVN